MPLLPSHMLLAVRRDVTEQSILHELASQTAVDDHVAQDVRSQCLVVIMTEEMELWSQCEDRVKKQWSPFARPGCTGQAIVRE